MLVEFISHCQFLLFLFLFQFSDPSVVSKENGQKKEKRKI